jgi:hypothetical protein
VSLKKNIAAINRSPAEKQPRAEQGNRAAAQMQSLREPKVQKQMNPTNELQGFTTTARWTLKGTANRNVALKESRLVVATLGAWLELLKFNKHCSTFVLFDKKFLILD